MRRLLTRVATGLHMAAFAAFCLATLPVFLFDFGLSAVRDRIEAQWPDSGRARAAGFWLGLLAPLALAVVLAVAAGFTVARIRALKQV